MKIELCDILSILLFVIILAFAIISHILANNAGGGTDDDTINHYAKLKTKYMRSSIWFLAGFYWLTLFSLLSTIIVIYLTSLAPEMNRNKVFLYSVISLLCTVVNFVMNLRDVSVTYRECSIRIQKAVLIATDMHNTDLHDSNGHRELYQADYETEQMLKNVIK